MIWRVEIRDARDTEIIMVWRGEGVLDPNPNARAPPMAATFPKPLPVFIHGKQHMRRHRVLLKAGFTAPRVDYFSGVIQTRILGDGRRRMGAGSDAIRQRAMSGGSVGGWEDGGGKGWSNGVEEERREEKSPGRLMTLPTVLTLGRVVAVPVLVSTFYVNYWWATTATTSIFLAAAITDWLDGYIARKMQLGTPFGAFLDPVADKLMVATTLVLLCTRPLEVPVFGKAPWLLTVPSIAIIGREITMSAVREWAASQNAKLLEAVAVNNLGKWKTATQMTALTTILASRGPSLTGMNAIVISGVILLYVSAGLALWSLVVYMKKIWSVLL